MLVFNCLSCRLSLNQNTYLTFAILKLSAISSQSSKALEVSQALYKDCYEYVVETTTRKLFTILLFGNVLTSRKWFGAVLVFTGLFADMIMGSKSPVKAPSKKDKETISKKKLLNYITKFNILHSCIFNIINFLYNS